MYLKIKILTTLLRTWEHNHSNNLELKCFISTAPCFSARYQKNNVLVIYFSRNKFELTCLECLLLIITGPLERYLKRHKNGQLAK